MTRKILLIASVAAIAAIAVVASASGKKHHAAPPVKVGTNAKFGRILENGKGHALYRMNGESTMSLKCTDSTCLSVWPPAAAKSRTAASGTHVSGLSVFQRSDTHKLQFAYKGEPLYTFVNDHKANQVSGQNVDGFVVVTVKKSQSTQPTQSAPSSGSYGGYGY